MEKYVNEYLKFLNTRPLRVAYYADYSEIKILAVIPDNDEGFEDALKMAEAKFNGLFSKERIFLKVFVLEESDNVEVEAPFISLDMNKFQ